MPDARGHERDALETDHFIAQQFNDQLECVVEQRRVQMMLIELGTHLFGTSEMRERRCVLKPSALDRDERWAITEAGGEREYGMTRAREIRLARRQIFEGAAEAHPGRFAQHTPDAL